MPDVKNAAPACLTDACLSDVPAALTEVTRINRDLGSIAGRVAASRHLRRRRSSSR